ncbi:MAG: response regulator [Burkholderiales bacterium]|nr:response regulator [Burkholderiales bacterium]
MLASRADVLLVEDEADDAELITRALVALRPGTRVAVATDGVEALRQLFDENADALLRPRLIVLDLNLPRLDGIQVLRCLHADARTAKIPVVVLSGTCSPEDVGASRSYGAKACMRKPHSGGDMRRLAEVLSSELH